MSVFPLGAHVDPDGARFAVASSTAEAVEVCLVDGDPGELTERRVTLTERTFGVWHGHVPGVAAGQRYGYRVHGPYRPWEGPRANPAKILVDPYARRITGAVTDLEAARGWTIDPMTGPPSTVDSLGHVPLSVLTAPPAPLIRPGPDVPWSEIVIAEVHVRGFTMRHPDVPPEQRGTYLGLAHPAVVAHLHRIGVTAVELLPVTATLNEPQLLQRGVTNYWGYSTLGFFAPHPGYASVPGAEIEEFQAMVDALHASGIEVILDVVPNHTCEGGVNGSTISFRGLDAPAYYSLRGGPRRRHHRHRQHPRLRLADRGSDGVRRPAQLGDDVRRRRLPRGPRERARQAPLRAVRPALRDADGDRDRPRARAVQADRRTVGRHRRRGTGWAGSRWRGRSGTAATATPSATSGAGAARSARWPRG